MGSIAFAGVAPDASAVIYRLCEDRGGWCDARRNDATCPAQEKASESPPAPGGGGYDKPQLIKPLLTLKQPL